MKRPSPAFVLSCIAIMLSFTGGAVAATQIGGKQIKDGSITGKDIKNDSLTAKDITGQLQGPRGPEGQRGPQGPAGQGGSGGANVSYQIAEGMVTADGFTTVDAPLPCRAGRRRGRLQRDPAGDRASLGAEPHGRTRRGLVDGAVRGRRHPADADRGRGVRGLRQRQRALRADASRAGWLWLCACLTRPACACRPRSTRA